MEDAAPSLVSVAWENNHILRIHSEQESTVLLTEEPHRVQWNALREQKHSSSQLSPYLWAGGMVEGDSLPACIPQQTDLRPPRPGKQLGPVPEERGGHEAEQNQQDWVRRGWHSVAIHTLQAAAVYLNHTLRTKEKNDRQESERDGHEKHVLGPGLLVAELGRGQRLVQRDGADAA